MSHINDDHNGETQETSLSSDRRCSASLRKWLIVSGVILVCLAVVLIIVFSSCSGEEEKKSAAVKTPASSAPVQTKYPETALSRKLRSELAYLQGCQKLTGEVVARYRAIRLDLPAKLTPGERLEYDRYERAYAKLRTSFEKAETELMLRRYEDVANARERAEKAERERHSRFLFAPSKPQPEKVLKEKKKTARRPSKHAIRKANDRYLHQLERELNGVYRDVYNLTSRMTIVHHIKDRARYAGEFALSVKMLEDWRVKKAQDPRLKKTPHLLPVWKNFDKNTVERTLQLLKHCQTIHEFTYKGGEKMKGVRIGRVRILSTNWKGIDFYDMQEKFEARLKVTELNNKLKRVLVTEGAKRCGKAAMTFDNLPILAYYYVFTGSAENVSAMNLGLGEQQLLISWSKNWGLPRKEQMFLQARSVK